MDLTGEQRQLRDAVRGLLTRAEQKEAPEPGTGPGRDRALWQRRLWERLCGEIGVAGLAIPERYGGAGAGPVETHVVMAELGRALTPAPLLGSAVLAGQALLAAGDGAACQRLLPGIAAGAVIAALAWTPESGGWDPAEAAFTATPPVGSAGSARSTAPAGSASTARPGKAGSTGAWAGNGNGNPEYDWALTGEAHYVLDGDVADVLLAAARTPDGIALFEVDLAGPGISRAAATTMDSTRQLAVVRLDDAAGRPIGTGGRLGGGCAALARARDLACIALSAEQVGAAGQALELTVAYSRDRVQFGRPIGSFQALQHRMAGLHVLVESAGALSFAAAGAAAQEAPDLALRSAAAKAYCSEVLQTVAGEMIQLHGAIGITWEHRAHRYLKRAHGAARLLGRPGDHIARIADCVLDGAALAES